MVEHTKPLLDLWEREILQEKGVYLSVPEAPAKDFLHLSSDSIKYKFSSILGYTNRLIMWYFMAEVANYNKVGYIKQCIFIS